MKFTDKKILNLKSKPERYELWEGGNGLGVRVSPKGRKSWVFMYRFEGKARRMTLGTYPDMSVAGAHKAHGLALELLEKNKDPGTLRVDENNQDRAASTVKDLAGEYIEKWAKPHKRSWKEDERMLNKDVVAVWGKRKAKDITRRDIIRLLDKVVERGSPVTANRVLALIRKMFNFAIERDIVQASPCVMIRAPGKETSKDRVLAEDEIKTLWKKLYSAKMSATSGLALKLLLLTAQRRVEVATADKKEFDLESGWWTIPAIKTKNGLTQRVPLSPLAINIIQRAMRLSSNETPCLFPSPRGKKSITATALTRTVSRNRDYFGIPKFAPHDLRRTAASMMTSAGISRLVVSRILNHAESGVTAVYDRHSYDKEKRQALELWSRKLLIILGGKKSNVTPLFTANQVSK